MRLYVLGKKSIEKYHLPSKIDGSFLFEVGLFSSNILLNVDSVSGEWVLKSNHTVKVISGMQFVETLVLHDFDQIFLQKNDGEKFCVVCLPTNMEDNLCYATKNAQNISIGSDSSNVIFVQNYGLEPQHTQIYNQDNAWYLAPSRNGGVYLNDLIVESPVRLKGGDSIFISGLKIIWMNQFFFMNQLNHNVVVKGLGMYPCVYDNENSESSEVGEEESSLVLYREEDYFSHTPRIKTVLEPEVVVIDAPPENQYKEDDLPFFLSIGTSLTMFGSAFMSAFTIFNGVMSGKKSFFDLLPNVIMLFTMVIGAFLIPQLLKKYRKKKSKDREQLRQKKYGEYLAKKEVEIQHILKNQCQIVTENSLSLIECQRIAMNTQNRQLWNREITDADFLTVRLGVGNCPAKLTIQAPEEHFTLDEDNLFQSVYKLKQTYHTLEKVPITISFLKDRISALILESSHNKEYLNGILLQLITLHSAQELKIVFFNSMNELGVEMNSYAPFIPHCWSEDKSTRLYASNLEDQKKINNYLERIYNERVVDDANKDTYSKFSSYYLVITNDFKNVKDYSFIQKILNSETNAGFSLLVVDHSLKNLPKECLRYIYINDTDSGLFDNELKRESAIKFTLEYDENVDMRGICNRLMNIPIRGVEEVHELPSVLYFLEMYNVGKIEQLNVVHRWQSNRAYQSLEAPVGVHENGEVFKLDLHEKASGPHGLIAGSTGSGKSEFIITYILSMAVSYHPDDVQFVLIDYKGGGLAGAFLNSETGIILPHLAGTITNLDTNEMNRTLVSIESELKRRQRKFNEVRESIGESTMDIYKYQKLYHEGVIKEPISHLFIISDEFAELKSQQPEFMAQLISTSRIGRSLGVHLILATQKPSGVVNDQIWSNSRFKVCLKVQSRADSMEMLKRPEAASIKQTGRFYLQVGYDESFELGQSAWSGAKYMPTDNIVRKVDDSVAFINMTGETFKSIEDKPVRELSVKDMGDQLTNIVRYLDSLAKRENIKRHSLWLPSLEKDIYLKDLMRKYSYKKSNDSVWAVIGEYDAPKNQQQGIFTIDLTYSGNTLIYGMAGSGKENLLITMMYSVIGSYGPRDAQFYIADFGSETLKVMKKFPHVGDVITIEESNKLVNFIKMLEKEAEQRKRLFADFGGSFQDYNKNHSSKIPLLICVINGFENYLENYPRMSEAFETFFRDGVKYGMVFVVTTSLPSSIRLKTRQNFLNKICLHMPNSTDYRDLLGCPRGLVPNDNFGRGVFAISNRTLEFQTAFVCPRETQATFLREEAKRFSIIYPESARKVPMLPDIVYAEDVLFELKGLSCFPIGIERNSLEVYVYDFTLNKINLILAKFLSNHIYFIYGLLKQFLTMPTVSVTVVDAMGIYKGHYDGIQVVQNNFKEFLKQLYENKSISTLQDSVYIFLGIQELLDKVDDEGKGYLKDVFMHANDYQDCTFLFASDYASLKKVQIEDWYRNHVDNSYGIWLGEDVGTQMALSIATLKVEDKSLVFPCISFVVYKGSHMIVKYVVDGVERQNEE